MTPSDISPEASGRLGVNELEAIAKRRPNDMFLKGSGVLKLIGAIRQLEGEVWSLKDVPTAAPSAVLSDLREGLGQIATRVMDNPTMLGCCRLIDEILSALACMPTWMPIESAPKHEEVLVWREDSGPFIAKLTTPDAVITPEEMEREGFEYPDDFEEWFSDAYGWQEGSEKPTLWQPLPPPPASTIQGANP